MNCKVIDPYNIITDQKMLFLADVICPLKVEQIFKDNLSILSYKYQLKQIKVIRYKPEKRCLIEYSWQGDDNLIMIGKIRAKGTDINSYNIQQQLWEKGFDSDSNDKISVPEVLGIIPQWQMWVQKKVLGITAFSALISNQGIEISQKIAQIADKLHQTNIPTNRNHTMKEELAILQEKLPLLLEIYPHWETRIKSILMKCNNLAETGKYEKKCGIHRDFYGDQIIVNKNHFYLLDLDLYCQGNPSLDIGNFLAHIREYSLRKLGNIDILNNREIALEKSFLELYSEKDKLSLINEINIYKILTLVRHIYISHRIINRRRYTEILLELCELELKKY